MLFLKGFTTFSKSTFAPCFNKLRIIWVISSGTGFTKALFAKKCNGVDSKTLSFTFGSEPAFNNKLRDSTSLDETIICNGVAPY
mgnify:CR=1 FL=1